MIAELAQAIIQQFQADENLRTALSGGLWFQRAKQKNATYPYAVFMIVSIEDDNQLGVNLDKTKSIRKVLVQFSIFTDVTDGGEQIDELFELLTDAFDWADLAYENFHDLKMERIGAGPIIIEDEIWQITADYDIWLANEVSV